MLDTILPDDFIREQREIDYVNMKKRTELAFRHTGLNKHFIKRVMLAYDHEMLITNSAVSGSLNNS